MNPEVAITVTKRSGLTGHVHDYPVTTTQPAKLQEFLDDPLRFGLIQDEFPEISPDDREFLISGATPEEWAEMLPPDDDDDDDVG